jgi:phage shock protein PspC (stress-responsive transcriptional regulator)
MMADTKSKKTTTDTEQPAAATPVKRLYRLPKSGVIAGVCAGLAEYFRMDVTLMRVIFVILTLASGGFGILVYLILAIIMPTSEATVSAHVTGKEFGDSISSLAGEFQDGGGANRLRNFFGLALILLGSWLLLVQFFPSWLSLNWSIVWPVVLILFGLFVLARSRR